MTSKKAEPHSAFMTAGPCYFGSDIMVFLASRIAGGSHSSTSARRRNSTTSRRRSSLHLRDLGLRFADEPVDQLLVNCSVD